MCGLVGIICKTQNGFNQKHIDIFHDLLYMDTLRGEDATGVALVTNNTETMWAKAALPAYYFRYTQEYKDITTKAFSKGKALLGHNRKKTMGENTDECAHPFLIENTKLFFHNGTLYNHKDLADTKVDSEALGLVLTTCKGKKEAIEAILAKVKGAYACVWYDQKENKIYFLRNKERPLYYGYTKDGTFIYSSEQAMIFAAATRNGIALESVAAFKDDVLYTMNVNIDTTLKEEPLSFFPQVPIIPHITVVGTNDSMSKNEFKRRAVDIGKKVWFFVEETFENTKNELIIIGENSDFDDFIFKVTMPKPTLYTPHTANSLLVGGKIVGEKSLVYYDKQTCKGYVDVKAEIFPSRFMEYLVQ